MFQKLKQTRDKLKQYQKKIVLSQERERAVAKECIKNGRKEWVVWTTKRKCHDQNQGQKAHFVVLSATKLTKFPPFYSKAMRLLKKKKYQDTLLAKTDTQLDNLEKLVSCTSRFGGLPDIWWPKLVSVQSFLDGVYGLSYNSIMAKLVILGQDLELDIYWYNLQLIIFPDLNDF